MNLMNKFSLAIRGTGSAEMEEDQSKTTLEDVKEKPSEDSTTNELERRLREAEEKADSYRQNEAEAMKDIRHYEDKKVGLTTKAANLKVEQDEVSKENASLMKTIEELQSKIRQTTAGPTKEAVSLKAELKSGKEKQNSLEKIIDELQKEMKGKEEKLNEANVMCKLYQNQTTDGNKAGKAPQEVGTKGSDDEATALILKEELEANKDEVNKLQEMSDSMKTDKEKASKKLLEVTQNLNEIKYLDGEKLVELQNAYDLVNEEKDSISQAIDTNRKIVEDQRHQLSTGVITLQQQKDMVSKKELERQHSIKQYKYEMDSKEDILDLMKKCAEDITKKVEISEAQIKMMIKDFGDDDHQQVIVLQKKVQELEQKLQMSDVIDKNKEMEEQKRVDLVNLHSTELGELEYQGEQLKEKVAELEYELKLINTKHAEQELIGRKKLADLTLLLDALKNKNNLNPEHAQVISDLENDLANTTYAKEAALEKKTREIVGEWRTKSFRYAKERTKCMGSFVNGKQYSMSQKCVIGVGLFAIFLGVLLLLGKRMLA